MNTLPRSVWLYTLCYAIMLSGTSLVVLIAGIIGQELAPSEALATLPIALMIVGVAAGSLPTSWLMSRYGRKPIFLGAAFLAIFAAIFAGFSIYIKNFYCFLIATGVIGISTASVQQYRFAAMELVDDSLIPRTASTILLGGILAAIIGPELSVVGRYLTEIEFAGSFGLLALLYLIGWSLLWFTPASTREQQAARKSTRSWHVILLDGNIIIAILAAAIGYGVMSFLMTATPLSMHSHHGHSLADTKWVIQSHVAAMYLPSLFSGFLIERFKHYKMMAAGVIAFISCGIIAYLSQSFWSFWFALVLLGVGWNFLFVAGTSLLAVSYRSNEKFRVQAFNDFLVFGTQAAAALSSGWLLLVYKWQGIILLSLLPIVLFVIAIVINYIREKRLLSES